MSKSVRCLAVTFCLLMVVSLGLGSLWAQSDRGTVTGVITDSSGAAIRGVSVTATNAGTRLGTTVVSSSSGNYTIPLLPAGMYTISAEQTGFKKFAQAGVIVEVGQTVSLDISMQVGSKTETVEVKGEVIQVEKDTTGRGAVVGGKDILDLPILGQGEQRNPGYFMTLVPGVTGRGISGGGSPRMLNTTVNGSQSASNEFQLDGSLIGSAAEYAGDFRNIPFPQDAVGEFKVITLLPPAEYGRTGQGITSFTLRSGTNQMHGSVYEYLRNEKLDAIPFFVNSSPPGCNADGKKVAPFVKSCRNINKQNEFGATVGGPIRIPGLYDGRGKTFFFGWYQGFQLRKQPTQSLDTLPTPAMRSGDLSNILGPQVAACGPDPKNPIPCFDALGRPVF